MIIKCKMCGGDIAFTPGDTYGTCEYCGSVSTIPKAEDEQQLNRYNRANHFRRQCEFDKAVAAYEKLLEQDDTDAEAHWGAVLSRYGIEYVEDPKTKQRIPTCHRVQVASILADADYLAAVEHAPDAESANIYKAEAQRIAEIQKGILAISANEKPYDVFICYKETDENGQRTRDSQWAQEIYYGLAEQGYKVFFSRITLEDKLGQQYEPYIFAALNSAKVMVAVGSKPEYFNAVWVKNEWSRYLALMANDRKRLLIPCYRGMDPYDLPEELSNLQSQDMGKIGFMQDLLRGVKKVLDAGKKPEAPKVQTVVTQATVGGTTTAAQVKRGNMALEDHEWEKADGFFEEALNLEPECAEAFIGKLLAREKKPSLASWVKAECGRNEKQPPAERLTACPEDTMHIARAVKENTVAHYLAEKEIRLPYAFDRGYDSVLAGRRSQREQQKRALANDRLLNRARQYAKGETKQQTEAAVAEINAALDARVAQAEAQDKASTERVCNAYKAHLAAADAKVAKLHDGAVKKREADYEKAAGTMNAARDKQGFANAKTALEAMHGYKDSAELARRCAAEIGRIETEERRAEEERRRQEEERRRQAEERERIAAEEAAAKRRRLITIATAAAALCVAVFLVVTKVIIPSGNYNKAVALREAGNYAGAVLAFEELGGYKDAATQVSETKYQQGKALLAAKNYDKAYDVFLPLKGYKDVDTLLKTDDNLAAAAAAREAKRKLYRTVGSVVTFGSYEQDNNTSNGAEPIEWIVLDVKGDKSLLIAKYGLDAKPYNTKDTSVTWEKCTLRTWLNGEFLNKAFTAEEQKAILTTEVDNGKSQGYSKWSTNGGNDTKDKVFLLSYAEANKYFGVEYWQKSGADKNTKSRVQPTAYAKEQGAWTNEDYKTAEGAAAGCWWLRSPGLNQDCAARVYPYGSLLNYVNDDGGCVRPAFWMNLESDIF
ncbi:MAG: DUF6273 domain-containing protein [Clostridia bacterium]|nr:DUF6273 domain-containing protein [Clostridia bacterium]